MKILYVTYGLPYPLDIGLRIRQFHILSSYARIGEVALMFTYADDSELEGMNALEPYCHSFHPISFDWGKRPKSPGLVQWRSDLREVWMIRPFISSLFYSPEMKRSIEKVAPGFNLIHVSRLSLVTHVESLLRNRLPGQHMILDMDDIETIKKRRILRLSPPHGWRAWTSEQVDLILLQRFQNWALRKFDRSFVCSERDRTLLNNPAKTVIVPNGADVKQKCLPDSNKNDTLLFVATFGYRPNVDGLFFFVRDIFPRIRRVKKNARLLVVGSNMPSEVRNLSNNDPTILTIPDVDSVEPFYQQAAVAVVPVKAGSGTRLKILEAFAFGRPVVSTSLGCEGLEAYHGVHLLVADEPDDFARSCLKLMSETEMRKKMIQRARRLVEEKYSWEAIEKSVEGFTEELQRNRFTANS